MKIYGVDFTSAPGRRKPITWAVCEQAGAALQLRDVLRLLSFAEFEELLRSPGPWIAGLDFPFGQPRRLLAALGWPPSWERYVGLVASLGRSAFEEALTGYKAGRPPGDKEHLRATDALAGSKSAMKLFNPPVGKMFFEGATRLLASGVSVQPCCPRAADRVVVEAYPALLARRWIGRRSYKSDDRARQSAAHVEARRAIVAGLGSDGLREVYGVSLDLAGDVGELLVGDPSGDLLDAALCAVQAAWANSRRQTGYGIPEGCEPTEGWIADPTLERESTCSPPGAGAAR